MFDPFCGSGSTLVESQRCGVPSVGVDLKSDRLPDEQGKDLAASFAIQAMGKHGRVCGQVAPVEPLCPTFLGWITGSMVKFNLHLQHCRLKISSTPSAQHDALRLALSSIIVRVSNQESDTRYAAINKGSTSEDVYTGLLRASEYLEGALRDRDYPLVPANVVEGDILEVQHSGYRKGDWNGHHVSTVSKCL